MMVNPNASLVDDPDSVTIARASAYGQAQDTAIDCGEEIRNGDFQFSPWGLTIFFQGITNETNAKILSEANEVFAAQVRRIKASAVKDAEERLAAILAVEVV